MSKVKKVFERPAAMTAGLSKTQYYEGLFKPQLNKIATLDLANKYRTTGDVSRRVESNCLGNTLPIGLLDLSQHIGSGHRLGLGNCLDDHVRRVVRFRGVWTWSLTSKLV